MQYTKNEYNAEPVFYCDSCLSLNIRSVSTSKLYMCGECGNTHIEETSIDEWTTMYNKQHGKDFISQEEVL